MPRRMKKIGFLSFGHWASATGSQVRSAADALLHSVELAVAAEELGADGAYFRVHHFAPQLASPVPLLAAAGARTRRICEGGDSPSRGAGFRAAHTTWRRYFQPLACGASAENVALGVKT